MFLRISSVLLVLIAVITLSARSGEVCAGSAFAPDACDADIMTSAKERAWMEAQREIVQNQNLIVKPDSVLEYTCYNQYLDQFAFTTLTAPLFSMDLRWQISLGDMAVKSLPLFNNMIVYLSENFSHTFLGHRYNLPNNTLPLTDVSYRTYGTCDAMNLVWNFAKCMNFVQYAGNDSFYTFPVYRDSNDFRALPYACSPSAASRWTNAISKATAGGVPWERDTVEDYYALFETGDANNLCGNVSAQQTSPSRVPTGLVFQDGSTLYSEQICLVPGCYYDAPNDQCILP